MRFEGEEGAKHEPESELELSPHCELHSIYGQACAGEQYKQDQLNRFEKLGSGGAGGL